MPNFSPFLAFVISAAVMANNVVNMEINPRVRPGREEDTVLWDQDNYADAEEMNRWAPEEWEKALGLDRPNT